MPPAPPQGWNQLKTTSPAKAKKQSCPKLFYNYSAAPKDGITLLVTDLISLWQSHFSPQEVLERAAAVHSSIDPSESNEQMQILLDKLALSLDQGNSKLARNGGNGKERLVIKASIDLPRPLRPLEWSFDLDTCDAAELAEQILRPTLHQLSVSQQKLEGLLKVVKEKDHVIEKLLDRVADKGVDMSLIFPTLTGTAKRGGSGVKVDDARRLVPGMKVFDLASWKKSLRDQGIDGAGDVSEMGLEKLVEGFEKCFAHSENEHSESLQKWFQRLPDVEGLETAMSKSNLTRSQSQSQSQSQAKAEEDTESENEFETQRSPPVTRRKRASPAAVGGLISSDDDVFPAPKRAKTGTAKLGGLGKQKKEIKPATRQEESSLPQPAPKSTSIPWKKSDSSTDTASDSDFESNPRSANQSPAKTEAIRLSSIKQSSKQPSPAPTTAKTAERSSSPAIRPPTASFKTSTPSHKLGGTGKTRQRTTTASPIPEAENHAQNTQQSEAVTPSRKLGRLGMRKKGKDEIQVEKATSPPSTRTRDKIDGKGKGAGDEPRNRRSGADGAGNGHDSDATASPSPSPSPSPSVRPTARDLRPSAQSPNKINDKGSVRSTTASRRKHSNSNSPKLEPQTAHKPEPEPDPEPETEEQKAAKRREELKRMIQAGGPKKKKRF